MREHWVKFGGKNAQPLEKVVPNGAHASAVFSLPEFPLLRPSLVGLVPGPQPQYLSLGTEPVQPSEEAVHRWRNSEPDVCGCPEAHGRDQLHPPAVVKCSTDYLIHLLPMGRVGALSLSRCWGDVASNPS